MRRCLDRTLQARTVLRSGVTQYRIAVESLPPEAQARYWRQQVVRQPQIERRGYLEQLNLEEAQRRRIARECGISRKEKPLQNLPWTAEEFAAKEQAFIRLPGSVQEEGNRRARLMRDLEARLRATGERNTVACIKQWADEQEPRVGVSTIYDWRKRIANLEPEHWRIALAPDYRNSGRPRLDVSEEMFAWIVREWGHTSKPPLRTVYRRAKKEAEARDLTLPSYATVKRRIDAVPRLQRVFMREGEKGLDAALPTMRRDYSTLELHEIWNSDGRVMDVHCVWPDGEIARPVVVAFMDVRSRVIVGWAVGKSESAHLVRAAIADSLRRTRAVPQKFYLDNGRGYASKEITGGQPTRYRFKYDEEEQVGIATLLGIGTMWATPYNGRAKPIESFWNRLVDGVDKRAEFVGAYTGSMPSNRPEEHDIKKAVPIARFMEVLEETIDAYHRAEHRGDAMDNESPRAVFDRLAPSCTATQPTERQLSWCLLASKQVKLTRERTIEVLGNRYGCDQLTALNSRGPYTVRYDPVDASRSALLFDGTQFLMEVPIIVKTGFADREAAQKHMRANRARKRAIKDHAQALKTMDAARSWDVVHGAGAPGAPSSPAGVLPRPGVPQVLTPTKDYRPRRASEPQDEDARRLEEFRAARDRGQALRDGELQEHEPRRAAGGM